MDNAKEAPAPVKKPEKSVTFQAASPTPKATVAAAIKPVSVKSQQPPIPVPQFTAKTVIIEERNGHSSPTVDEASKRSSNRSPNKPSPTPPHHQHHQEPVIREQETRSPVVVPVRPESPSPDYSNSPSPSPSPPRIRSPHNMSGVDMESLESFRLKNPPKNVQKPPPFYFNEAAMQMQNAAAKAQAQAHYNATGVIDEKMVRMAAYPSAYTRPEPSRLGFLGNGKGPAPPVPNGVKAEVILHRELEDALSRCNINSCNGSRDPGNAKIMMAANGAHHNQCQTQSVVQNGSSYCNGKCTSNGNKTGNQANGKPNGGILKMSNGGGGGSSSNKTISFGGRY